MVNETSTYSFAGEWYELTGESTHTDRRVSLTAGTLKDLLYMHA